MAIVKGEQIELKAVFTDDSGTNTDPTTPVDVTVRQPDGTKDVDAQQATKSSTGVFTFNYTTSVSGTHYYKFVSADNAVEQDSFEVEADDTE